MGRGSTAAAASPQVTAVGLLGCADPTTLPPAAMMLTVYVSPDGWVDSTANAPVRGTGDAAGETGGDAAAVEGGEPVGKVVCEVAALGEGDAPACEPGPPQPAMTWSASRRTPYSNANVRTALRFRYDPASEAGPDPHPQSDARTGTHGRLGLSVLFYVGGGIPRTLNLAEVTSHLV